MAIDRALRLDPHERRAIRLAWVLRARDKADYFPIVGVPDGDREIASLVALENDLRVGDALSLDVVHQRGGGIGGSDEVVASLWRQ